MSNVKEIYCGCIRIPSSDNDGNMKFEYDYKYATIKVKKEYIAGYILDNDYCTRNGYFTRYLKYEVLDSIRKISNEISCMYSTDKNKIIEWMSKEREKLLAKVEMKYNSLKESIIDEVTDINSIIAPNANKEPLEVVVGHYERCGIYHKCPHCDKKVKDARPEYGNPKKIACEHCSGLIIWTAMWDYSDIGD